MTRSYINKNALALPIDYSKEPNDNSSMMLTIFYALYIGLNFISVISGRDIIGIISFGILLVFLICYSICYSICCSHGKTRFNRKLLLISCLAIIILSIRFMLFGTPDVKQLAFVPHTFIAILLFDQFRTLPHRWIYRIISAVSLFFIIVFTQLGNTEFVNRTFFNSFLFIMLCCAVFFCKDDKTAIILDLGIFVLVSIATVSRSGILAMALIILLYFFKSMGSTKNFITVFAAMTVIFLLIVVVVGLFFRDFSSELVERFNYWGLSSRRWNFWCWYLGQQDLFSVFYGSNSDSLFNDLALIFFENTEDTNTLHNSFLQFHVYYGFLAVILFGLCIVGAVRLLKMNVFWGFLWGLLLFRGMLDTILLVQRYDFIFLMVMIWAVEQTRRSKSMRGERPNVHVSRYLATQQFM